MYKYVPLNNKITENKLGQKLKLLSCTFLENLSCANQSTLIKKIFNFINWRVIHLFLIANCSFYKKGKY